MSRFKVKDGKITSSSANLPFDREQTGSTSQTTACCTPAHTNQLTTNKEEQITQQIITTTNDINNNNTNQPKRHHLQLSGSETKNCYQFEGSPKGDAISAASSALSEFHETSGASTKSTFTFTSKSTCATNSHQNNIPNTSTVSTAADQQVQPKEQHALQNQQQQQQHGHEYQNGTGETSQTKLQTERLLNHHLAPQAKPRRISAVGPSGQDNKGAAQQANQLHSLDRQLEVGINDAFSGAQQQQQKSKIKLASSTRATSSPKSVHLDARQSKYDCNFYMQPSASSVPEWPVVAGEASNELAKLDRQVI